MIDTAGCSMAQRHPPPSHRNTKPRSQNMINRWSTTRTNPDHDTAAHTDTRCRCLTSQIAISPRRTGLEEVLDFSWERRQIRDEIYQDLASEIVV
ncbi:MAG: hypothetical protein AAF670_12200 [Planctomycetota bacterium]